VIQIQLDVNEVNVIMMALGQMPFAQVEPLVNKIREQVIPQAQETPQETLAEAQ